MAFTKTHFAGIDTHIRAVELLEYAAAKYFDEFEINDDCEYVKHRDRDESLKVFDTINDGLILIEGALESIDTSKIKMSDDAALFKAIEDRIKLFMKKNKQ